MRVTVPVVVEFDAASLREFAEFDGVPLRGNGTPYAKDVVSHVREYLSAAVKETAADLCVEESEITLR
jgi:hypothetical protein